MTSPTSLRTLFRMPLDHLDQLSRGISALTVDPYRNAVSYFFPIIGAFFSHYNQVREDDLGHEAMMPCASKKRILDEIRDLTVCAGMKREVLVYSSLSHQFSNAGGSFSFTKPILFLPYHHLFRPQYSHFTQEKPGENLAAKDQFGILSDHEVRFFISRSIAEIKGDSALWRIAIKVTMLVTFLIVCANPFGWPGAIALSIVAATFVVTERFFHGRADVLGAQILGKRLKDVKLATQIAIAALEKARLHNIQRRDQSFIARLYITPSGNNRLDFQHPYLTNRIARLKATL